MILELFRGFLVGLRQEPAGDLPPVQALELLR